MVRWFEDFKVKILFEEYKIENVEEDDAAISYLTQAENWLKNVKNRSNALNENFEKHEHGRKYILNERVVLLTN